MSASLVGSEMCIRDSACTVTADVAACPKSFPHLSSFQRCRFRAPRIAPVSYTHLTLPTICSV
eukprot:13323288-Alexandrium_andersonii.AAC.1